MESILLKIIFIVFGIGGIGMLSVHVTDIQASLSDDIKIFVISAKAVKLNQNELRVILDVSNIQDTKIDTVTVLILDDNNSTKQFHATTKLAKHETKSFKILFDGEFTYGNNYIITVYGNNNKGSSIHQTMLEWNRS